VNADKPYDRDWTWHAPSTDDEREDRAAWSLVEESRIAPARVYRARRRLREQPPVASPRYADTWVLPGLDAFGDDYPDYTVTLRDGRYSCSCWGHAWGGSRARRFCSHVLAVVLWRRRSAGADTRPPQLADEHPAVETAESAALSPPPASATEPGVAPDSWSCPADLGLPGDRFPAFRGVQLYGLRCIVRAFESGAKVVFCQAPTGAGKSLIAAAVGRILRMPVLYTSTTKLLQDQYVDSFPDAKTLKGRVNYTPLNYLPPEPGCDEPKLHEHDGGSIPTCAECDKEDGHCTLCHHVARCPYEVAKRAALTADQAVLNTAYYIAECNTAGRFSDWSRDGPKPRHPAGPRLVVFDEGDHLENALMSAVTLEVTRQRMRELEIGPPPHKDPSDKEGEWGAWLQDTVLPAAERRLGLLSELHAILRDAVEAAESRRLSARDQVPVSARARQLWPLVAQTPLPERVALMVLRKFTARVAGRARGLGQWVAQARFMVDDLHVNPRSWVRTDDPDREETLTFKPVRVDRFGEDRLWRHATRYLVMSATLLSKRRMCHDLGVREEDAAWVDLPSTFPPERRPVYYLPVASMDRSVQAESLPAVLAALNRIVDERPGRRILVHAVSYRLTDQLCAGLRDQGRLVTFGGGKARDYGPGDFGPGGRDAALRYYAQREDAVLIAPALERGIDLPDDLCRCVVVVKIPKPSLGDKQVARRLYAYGREGKEWYAAQTVRNLCQATGRGFRHQDDWCETYILDESFDRLWREHSDLFPRWWTESLVRLDPATWVAA
jgi:Rad3-related DNA helicase